MGDDAFADLDALVEFVATSTATRFRNKIASMIQVADFQNWWIFVTFTDAADSGGKNSYLYHDASASALWRCAPWDF